MEKPTSIYGDARFSVVELGKFYDNRVFAIFVLKVVQFVNIFDSDRQKLLRESLTI
jgi:hypothetical protein